ncbi:MAG: hypothetical protein A3G34_06225 [Candidatus Lindowbacteria bacterium RIFCSPLOWO2_12_FULL_62_27]|nr:MAG: hypothetical protein A3G34_06225 [Candidatus Lindowbacteria bacterium RIFCSPLOWO2_12_FULL_62_27]OGH58762.1 MAG: hypothetical protein A3I06_09610 [Candidatus Lindowbacteria bacterium RIFCSPLOWO2_02_FULL_62_12]
MGAVSRWFRKVSGFALLIGGIVMSVPVLVPGWGLPVIIAGLAILAPEYEWARKLYKIALDLYHRILDKVRRRKEGAAAKEHPPT